MSHYRKIVIPLFTMLFAISMISTAALQNNAYAGLEPGMSVSVTASEGSGKISIGGYTGAAQSDAITITVVAPNGNIVTVDQLSPGSDGAFSSEIGVGGPMWSQDGIYTVTAIQGDATAYQSTVEVDIADGAVIPEFGTVASLVLVIAITSIIILSAKGRLSIAPKL